MESTIFTLAGWVAFGALLVFYVRWVILERDYFAGQAPENWRPADLRDAPSMRTDSPARPKRLDRVPSLGRMA